MLSRDQWLDLARKLDWKYSYVQESEVFPEIMSGVPWLPHEAWAGWDEPYRTSYREYVENQSRKDASAYAVREAVGRAEDHARRPPSWRSALELHAAIFTLGEFAAVVGELRAARFGRDGAWRTMATLGALDELRHTQLPLSFLHELLRVDPRLDWTHRLFHTDQWIAVAARHLIDEMILGTSAIDLAVGTNFVFETGFTNLQFLGVSALAHRAGDPMFEKMVKSIQTDEARHAQIGRSVLRILVEHDRARAQRLLDKWFWRSWLLFSILTGFSMDYLTPVDRRGQSFAELVEEWVVDQYLGSLRELGLEKPWYWDTFLQAIELYHHMVYVSAYTYRATAWFDFVVPGPEERAWLRGKYPRTWGSIEPVWERVTELWKSRDPGDERGVHGGVMVGLCDLCQLVLCNGTPEENAARTLERDGRTHIFCSEPCRWIFEQEPERYASHRTIAERILEGSAPATLPELVQEYFGLAPEISGKDAFGGVYPWLQRPTPGS
jgi:toluene monooxygenase system protein A